MSALYAIVWFVSLVCAIGINLLVGELDGNTSTGYRLFWRAASAVGLVLIVNGNPF